MKNRISKILMAAVLSAILVCMCIPFGVSADSLHSFMPSNDSSDGEITLTGCTLTKNIDGSVTVTLTATAANIKMVYAKDLYQEGEGTVLAGDAIDLTGDDNAYVVYDFYTTEGTAISELIFHYTRSDKAANNTLADLYLVSMTGNDFTAYRKAAGEGYGVWDWGKYVKDKPGIIDAGNRFVDYTMTITGPIGGQVIFYNLFVSDTAEIEGLGDRSNIPEPTESDETSEVTSEETSSEETSVADTSSEETSSVADTSSQETSSQASSADTSAQESEGMATWQILLIVVAALVVVGVIVFVVIKKKK